MINPDGKPYELPPVEVKVKIKLPKGEPIGNGGWDDGGGIAIVGGGGAIAGGTAGGAITKGGGQGGGGGGGQGNQGDNSNNPEDYPTIDPFEVRFTQDSCSDTFRNGITIDQLAEGLKDGSVPANAIPAIRVTFISTKDGLRMFSLDNRRLEAFRRANVKIPYRLVQPHTVVRELLSKYTTKNDGTSIRVRRGQR